MEIYCKLTNHYFGKTARNREYMKLSVFLSSLIHIYIYIMTTNLFLESHQPTNKGQSLYAHTVAEPMCCTNLKNTDSSQVMVTTESEVVNDQDSQKTDKTGGWKNTFTYKFKRLIYVSPSIDWP